MAERVADDAGTAEAVTDGAVTAEAVAAELVTTEAITAETNFIQLGPPYWLYRISCLKVQLAPLAQGRLVKTPRSGYRKKGLSFKLFFLK